jgi:thioredoxin 2
MATVIVSCSACGGKNRIPDMKQHLHPKCGRCKAPLVIDRFVVPVELSDANMDSFVKSASLPVLVDFFSPTCGPCKTLAPVLRNLARKFHCKIIVATVDTSTNPGCSGFYKIKGVPTLMFFKDGAVVDQIVGLPEPAMLESKMEYFAGK